MKTVFVRHPYTSREVAELMKQFDLTPTPSPTLPFRVELGDGRVVECEESIIADGDDPGDDGGDIFRRVFRVLA